VAVGLSPLQEEYFDRLAELVHRAGETGRGRVVFLAGGPGSGRSFWSDTVERRLINARVVAGGFQDGEYVPRNTERRQALSADDASLITSVAALGTLLGPVAALVGGLITVSVAARGVLAELRQRGRVVGLHELLPRLLRAAAHEDSTRPLVCLIDDADMAEGNWWASLLLSFAQEIELELPLVLVMGVDGPAELDDAPRAGRRTSLPK
jgi:AAA ATPase domain